MADEQTGPDLGVPENVWKILLEPTNHALAAGLREALRQGVPVHTTIEMLLNQIASIVANVQPPQIRGELTQQIIRSLGPLVQKYVERANITPGGVIMARAI